jgi:dihydropteroate synthase
MAGRDDASVAVTALAAAAGVWGVRVHAVRPNADAVRAVAAWQAAR